MGPDMMRAVLLLALSAATPSIAAISPAGTTAPVSILDTVDSSRSRPGAIFPAAPDAIAGAIAMLITDQPLRESLAHKGAGHARAHFGIEAQAARLDAFCATIARQSDPTRLSNRPPAVHFQHDARH